MNPKTIRTLNRVRMTHRRIDNSSLSSTEKEEAENLFMQVISTARNTPSRKALSQGETKLRALCEEYLYRFEKGDRA